MLACIRIFLANTKKFDFYRFFKMYKKKKSLHRFFGIIDEQYKRYRYRYLFTLCPCVDE